MKNIIQIIIAILVIIVAWKLLKGLIGLLIGVAAIGMLIYGGVKLLENKS